MTILVDFPTVITARNVPLTIARKNMREDNRLIVYTPGSPRTKGRHARRNFSIYFLSFGLQNFICFHESTVALTVLLFFPPNSSRMDQIV